MKGGLLISDISMWKVTSDRHTGKGKDQGADGSDTVDKSSAVGDANLLQRQPVTCGSSGRAVLHTGSDSQGEESGEDGEETDPAEHRDLAEGGNERHAKDDDGGDSDKDGGAGAVNRQSVQSGGKTVHGRARDEHHEEGEADSKSLGTEAAKHDFTGIRDGVCMSAAFNIA